MSDGRHPSGELDDTVHQRVRLGILSVLMEVRRADFATLKRMLELSDGNLNRHLEVLAVQGLVTVSKRPDRGRSRTWIALTADGRAALRGEMRALGELVRRFESASVSKTSTRARTVRTAPAS